MDYIFSYSIGGAATVQDSSAYCALYRKLFMVANGTDPRVFTLSPTRSHNFRDLRAEI
jgi:hypothetical protein